MIANENQMLSWNTLCLCRWKVLKVTDKLDHWIKVRELGKILVKIIWIWEEYDWNENSCNRAHIIVLIVEVLNHGYGESWMFLRTLRDRTKDFSHGYNGYIFQHKVQRRHHGESTNPTESWQQPTTKSNIDLFHRGGIASLERRHYTLWCMF